MKEVGNHSIVVGNVAAVSIDEDSVTETYELKIDTLHRVHYLGKFCKTIFVGVGKMHDVERYNGLKCRSIKLLVTRATRGLFWSK